MYYHKPPLKLTIEVFFLLKNVMTEAKKHIIHCKQLISVCVQKSECTMQNVLA